MRPPTPLTPARRLAVLLVTVLALVPAATVSAHTDLEFTLPVDGAAVGEPVREITVAFDDPVTLVGPGFEVLDPQGTILVPFVATDDDMLFRLQLDPAIGGGEAAVRYEVRAEDGHTIAGGFSFTISADPPPPTTTTTTTTTSITTSTITTSTITTSTVAGSGPTPTTVLPPDTLPDTLPVGEAPGSTTARGGTDTEGAPDDGAPVTAIVVVAAAVALAAAGFLVARSRRSSRIGS